MWNRIKHSEEEKDESVEGSIIENENNWNIKDEEEEEYRLNRRRYIEKRRPMRCKIHECPFADADTLPTYAFVIDSLSEKDKEHIKMFHPAC